MRQCLRGMHGARPWHGLAWRACAACTHGHQCSARAERLGGEVPAGGVRQSAGGGAEHAAGDHELHAARHLGVADVQRCRRRGAPPAAAAAPLAPPHRRVHARQVRPDGHPRGAVAVRTADAGGGCRGGPRRGRPGEQCGRGAAGDAAPGDRGGDAARERRVLLRPARRGAVGSGGGSGGARCGAAGARGGPCASRPGDRNAGAPRCALAVSGGVPQVVLWSG